MSPNVHFTGPVGGLLADIDISTTHVAGVAGFSYRPRLGEKVVLLTQADIGGGSAFTWSATGGVEFLIKPWIGLGGRLQRAPHRHRHRAQERERAGQRRAVRRDAGYGPAFSLTFHWSENEALRISRSR